MGSKMRFQVQRAFNVSDLTILAERTSGDILILARGRSASAQMCVHKLTGDEMIPLNAGLDRCRHQHHIITGAVDPCSGILFVTDKKSIGIVQENGCVYALAGKRNEAADVEGIGLAARFVNPTGLAFRPDGNVVIVCDRDIDKLKLLTRQPSGWKVEGIPDPHHLVSVPDSVAYNQFLDAFLVTCHGNGMVLLISPDSAGKYTIQRFAGVGEPAMFSHPNRIACDTAGNVIVADQHGTALRYISVLGLAGNIEVINTSGEVVELGEDSQPLITRSGALYLADSANNTVYLLNHGGALAGGNSQDKEGMPAFSLGKILWEQQQAGAFCDVTFEVGNESIGAHRVVLVARSDYFATRFSTGVGTQSPVIVIEDTTPHAFRAVLCWLYTNELTMEDEAGLADVLLLAKLYLLNDLGSECMLRIESSLTNISNAVRLFVWGAHNSVDFVREKAKTAVIAQGKNLSRLPPADIALLQQHPLLMFELLAYMGQTL